MKFSNITTPKHYIVVFAAFNENVFLDLFEKIIQEERAYGFRPYNRMKRDQRDYKSVQDGHRPDSSYIRETIQKEREKNQLRKLPPKTERKSTKQFNSETSSSTQSNSPLCEGTLKPGNIAMQCENTNCSSIFNDETGETRNCKVLS